MPNAAETADYETLRADIAALKKQLADVVRHGKSAASVGAKRAYDDLADRGERTVEGASDYVKSAPLTSLAVAFIVGCVAGRLAR
jgi:ElaB/YqjD/DUF883 family membrane-anchored ribosome-binding protein